MTVEVPLGGRKAAGRVALVDDADWSLVSRYRWHVMNTEPGKGGPYAATSVYRPGRNPRVVKMHILITGQRGLDHANGNGLDNRRANLRPATNSQNGANRGPNRNSTSGFKGVTPDPSPTKPWRAQINHGGRVRTLGRYNTPEDAARAYDAAARKAWPGFARTNFP